MDGTRCPKNTGFIKLTMEAMRCRSCFDDGLVEPATIDLAQPRWVGPDYWGAKRRIAILLINPGSGAQHAAERNLRDRRLLHRARQCPLALYEYLGQQRQDLIGWGRGRFWSFFMEKLELDPDEIALANIAWCASRNDRYPQKMLTTCFERFTSRLLNILNPDIVLLCGAASHRFNARVQKRLPHSKILQTIHFAHRKGSIVESVAVKKLKMFL